MDSLNTGVALRRVYCFLCTRALVVPQHILIEVTRVFKDHNTVASIKRRKQKVSLQMAVIVFEMSIHPPYPEMYLIF